MGWITATFRQPRPTGPSLTLRTFHPRVDVPLTHDVVRVDGDAWLIEVDARQTVRLFEITDPGVEQCLVAFRARLRTERLIGRAYLEMWCRLPGRGEFFSRGLHQTVKGTTDWVSCEIPFYLRRGQRPDLIKLNVVVEGAGRVRLRDLEVLSTPLH